MKFSLFKLSIILKAYVSVFYFSEISFTILKTIFKLTFIFRLINVLYLSSSMKFIMFKISLVWKSISSFQRTFTRLLIILQRTLVNSTVFEFYSTEYKWAISKESFLCTLFGFKISIAMELIIHHLTFVDFIIVIYDFSVDTLSIRK